MSLIVAFALSEFTEEAVAAAANKHTKVAAERKSRRALGDIGNLIPVNGAVEGKPIPQISRPITR